MDMICDFKDPDDKQGRTYREVNNATKHSFDVGSLVELYNKERLYIVKQTRDCDGTPLYVLGIHGHDTCYHGFPEDCLTEVK